ncbi:hypothetical protein KQQSB11_640001 [Klebsiella quasipneumoniae subsp. quasipneumoniae]|nr:hypothetical protein KQQSB11_640001 [Klebsiella quasipneumoniae subsp. quasipneumoniae]
MVLEIILFLLYGLCVHSMLYYGLDVNYHKIYSFYMVDYLLYYFSVVVYLYLFIIDEHIMITAPKQTYNITRL